MTYITPEVLIEYGFEEAICEFPNSREFRINPEGYPYFFVVETKYHKDPDIYICLIALVSPSEEGLIDYGDEEPDEDAPRTHFFEEEDMYIAWDIETLEEVKLIYNMLTNNKLKRKRKLNKKGKRAPKNKDGFPQTHTKV